jgi:hypothetical protein
MYNAGLKGKKSVKLKDNRMNALHDRTKKKTVGAERKKQKQDTFPTKNN